MDAAEQGFYLGRFQPFSLKHLSIVEGIISTYPEMALTLGVAGWTGERDRSNFLVGDEVAEIARLTIYDAGLENRVGVSVIELHPETTVEESVAKVIPSDTRITVFSGSPKTLGALHTLNSMGFDLNVVKLEDDDITPPRSREIRESILIGSEVWRSAVTPSVERFLSQDWVRERLLTLPEGNSKRPWKTSEGGNLPGLERR